MQNELEKSQHETTTAGNVCFTPRVDILENDDALTLYADVPGARSDAIDIRFERGELAIYAQCRPRQQETRYMAAEYGVGDFYRAFSVHADVDADKITAELKNGVLTVHLPKSEAVKPRKIAISAT